jgi:hypothetical protein
VGAGTALVAPLVLPRSVLGADDAVPPSERVVLGAIGIGGRGSYVLSCFLNEKEEANRLRSSALRVPWHFK